MISCPKLSNGLVLKGLASFEVAAMTKPTTFFNVVCGDSIHLRDAPTVTRSTSNDQN